MNNYLIIGGIIIVILLLSYFLFFRKKVSVHESKDAIDKLSAKAVSKDAMDKREADKLAEKALANVPVKDEVAKKAIESLKEAATSPSSASVNKTAVESATAKSAIKETAKEEQKRILKESVPSVKEKFSFYYGLDQLTKNAVEKKDIAVKDEARRLTTSQEIDNTPEQKQNLINFWNTKNYYEALALQHQLDKLGMDEFQKQRYNTTNKNEAETLFNIEFFSKNNIKNSLNQYRGVQICALSKEQDDKNKKIIENIFMLLNKDTFLDSLNISPEVLSELKQTAKVLQDKYTEISKYNIQQVLFNAVFSEILFRTCIGILGRGVKEGKDRTEYDTLLLLLILLMNSTLLVHPSNPNRISPFLYDETNNILKPNPEFPNNLMLNSQIDKPMTPSQISDKIFNGLSSDKSFTDKVIIAHLNASRRTADIVFDKDIFLVDSTKPCKNTL